MNEDQMRALQRYISAVTYFMLHDDTSGGSVTELLAAKTNLEVCFVGKKLPNLNRARLPDIL